MFYILLHCVLKCSHHCSNPEKCGYHTDREVCLFTCSLYFLAPLCVISRTQLFATVRPFLRALILDVFRSIFIFTCVISLHVCLCLTALLVYFWLLCLFLSSVTLLDSSAEVMEVDHDKQLVFFETLGVSSLTAHSPAWVNGSSINSTVPGLGLLGVVQPTDEQVAARLSAPAVTTQLDTRNIAFERSEKIDGQNMNNGVSNFSYTKSDG